MTTIGSEAGRIIEFKKRHLKEIEISKWKERFEQIYE